MTSAVKSFSVRVTGLPNETRMLRLRPSTMTRSFGYSLARAVRMAFAARSFNSFGPRRRAVPAVGIGYDDAEVDVGQRVQGVAMRDRAVDIHPAAREGGAEGSADRSRRRRASSSSALETSTRRRAASSVCSSDGAAGSAVRYS